MTLQALIPTMFVVVLLTSLYLMMHMDDGEDDE